MHSLRDLPPPYSSLDLSTANTAILEAVHYEIDDQAGLVDNYTFEDKTTRIGFIQKVLATKFLQLLGICVVMAFFVANRWPVVIFLDDGYNLLNLNLLSGLLYILMFTLLVFCAEARRKNPYQYLFLVAYPLSMSFFISTLTIYWHILQPIFLSFVYYCVFIFVLLIYNIYACQTKLEFNHKSGFVTAVATQLVMYIFTVPFMDIKPNFVIFPSIIMLLEYVYLLFDIEAMTSENYWYNIKPGDYINGTLNLHIDYLKLLYNSKIVTALRKQICFSEVTAV